MIGTVLNEFATIIRSDPAELQVDNKNTWSQEIARAKLVERHGDKADAVAEAFLKAYPDKKYADAYFVDTRGRSGTIRNARLKADQKGAPVYTYVFTYESPVMDGVGMAWHGTVRKSLISSTTSILSQQRPAAGKLRMHLPTK